MKSTTTIGVVGAGGFVGSRLMEISRCTPDIHAIPIVRSYKALGRLKRLPEECKIVNTSSVLALADAFASCDMVVNLTYGDSSRVAQDAITIYEACVTANVPTFVHTSSAIVLGHVPDPSVTDDLSSTVPRWSFYAREKAHAEALLKTRMGTIPPAVVVLRPGLIWGPGSAYSCMPAQELWSGQAALLNNGQGICNLIHVDNLAQAIFAIARGDHPTPGFYNIADPGTTTWLEFYTATAQGLEYPTNRITLLPNAHLRFSPRLLSEWIVNNSQLCKLQKWALKRLNSRVKSVIKRYIKGADAPPVTDGGSMVASNFSFTREKQLMQTVAHPLNCDQFNRHFGPVQMKSFKENMEANIAWLRYAGFAANPTRGAGQRLSQMVNGIAVNGLPVSASSQTPVSTI